MDLTNFSLELFKRIDGWVSPLFDRVDALEKAPKTDLQAQIDEAVAKAIAELPVPQDGKDGEDGILLEIIPLIDLDKSYERGIYAIHKGGVWHSHQKTTGEHGWECVLNGVQGIEVEQDGVRGFKVSSLLTNGTKSVKEFELPHLMYRNIYKAETDYAPGDMTTFGGSLWHCNEDTQEKPGTSKHWTLVAKKGRDGKDKD